MFLIVGLCVPFLVLKLSTLAILCDILIIIFIPFIFVCCNILITPLDTYLKSRIISKAQAKIRSLKNLKVIAITGSYGKTSTREILTTLLSEKFIVVSPEGNKNTPLWVSETILNKLSDVSDIFIVEMWAYQKGDIQELCHLVPPDISILTGITMQHLERFWNIETIQDTKFEILECLKKGGSWIIDISGKWTQEAYERKKKMLQEQEIILISKPENYSYIENFKGMIFSLNEEKYTTKLIAPHAINTIKIAVECAKKLWLTQDEIKKWIEKIDYISHRMEVIHTPRWVIVIDDSYNGNIEWIQSIIELLEKTPFTGRKVIVAGGVVELWASLKEVNQKIGADFAKVADLVLIAKWPIGESIVKWLILAGFVQSNIKIYPHTLDIHKDLPNVILPWDVVVFQNDLPDTYL